jgi:hypothetical protein
MAESWITIANLVGPPGTTLWSGLTGTPPALSIFSGTLAWTVLTGVPSTFAPSAHASTHAHGGADPVTITYADLASIPASFTPSAHPTTHKSGGSDAIALDTLAAPTDITTLNASSSKHGLLVKASGTATDFVGGDNACHAHTTVPLDTLGATTDITTLNVSTTAHGLCPKAPNNTTTFLRGDATYSTIPLDGYTLQNGVYRCCLDECGLHRNGG